MVKKSLWNLLFFLLSFSSPCWAQGTDVPGSRDHTFISRYAGSVILGYDVRDHLITLLPCWRLSKPNLWKPGR